MMGAPLKSRAEPVMLAWCRTSARRSAAEAAKALRVPEPQIVDWEEGQGTPTFGQLKKLAKLYRRPTCVFYLKSPPTDFTVMRDFRTQGSSAVLEFSAELAAAIRDARERSVWLSEYLKGAHEQRLDFVGQFSATSGKQDLGKALRELVGMTMAEQAECRDNAAAFRLWRRKCEAVGVCVFTVGRVELAEMRGFAIVDPYAPVVAVNRRDSFAAKSFTLLHEMAHLLVGEEGVSNLLMIPEAGLHDRSIEVCCNAAAAEALVPRDDLLEHWKSIEFFDEDACQRLANRYRVSDVVVARRLRDFGEIPNTLYHQIQRNSEVLGLKLEGDRKANSNKPRRINQALLAKGRVGVRFSREAISAFQDGEISGYALSQLLGMKLKHLDKLETALAKEADYVRHGGTAEL
jgi:Zn-dependent peptidase ImmA (M78 family)